MLEIVDLSKHYGEVKAVQELNLTIQPGEVFTMLGANGAGKTTTLKAISNLLKSERGDVTKGSIEFRGEQVETLSPNDLVKRGEARLMFNFMAGERQVGRGEKKMVLGGLRPFEATVVKQTVDEFLILRQAYSPSEL